MDRELKERYRKLGEALNRITEAWNRDPGDCRDMLASLNNVFGVLQHGPCNIWQSLREIEDLRISVYRRINRKRFADKGVEDDPEGRSNRRFPVQCVHCGEPDDLVMCDPHGADWSIDGLYRETVAARCCSCDKVSHYHKADGRWYREAEPLATPKPALCHCGQAVHNATETAAGIRGLCDTGHMPYLHADGKWHEAAETPPKPVCVGCGAPLVDSWEAAVLDTGYAYCETSQGGCEVHNYRHTDGTWHAEPEGVDEGVTRGVYSGKADTPRPMMRAAVAEKMLLRCTRIAHLMTSGEQASLNYRDIREPDVYRAAEVLVRKYEQVKRGAEAVVEASARQTEANAVGTIRQDPHRVHLTSVEEISKERNEHIRYIRALWED